MQSLIFKKKNVFLQTQWDWTLLCWYKNIHRCGRTWTHGGKRVPKTPGSPSVSGHIWACGERQKDTYDSLRETIGTRSSGLVATRIHQKLWFSCLQWAPSPYDARHHLMTLQSLAWRKALARSGYRAPELNLQTNQLNNPPLSVIYPVCGIPLQ